jgi:hypothetical protein
MKRLLIFVGLLVSTLGHAQTVFDCEGFTASGSCSAAPTSTSEFWLGGSTNGATPGVSGSQVDLAPTGATHVAINLNYAYAAVPVQAFTATFTFVPNGQNVSFVLNNTTNNNNANGPHFTSGAGCEAAFFQAFGGATVLPNNIFAIEFDSYSPLTAGASFTYSSVQWYQAGISPCNPNDSGNNFPTKLPKISTSPVNLTTGQQNTTTGDTYSATITYDGNNVVVSLYDVTAGGSCPGSKCFSYTWTSVDIPTLVNGTTAWVGLAGATGLSGVAPLYINSFSYASGAASPRPQAPTNLSAAVS